MVEPLLDQVTRKIEQAAHLYHRLVLIVAPAGGGKTAVLRDLHDRLGAPRFNINLEISRRMLELTQRQRALQLPRLLDELLADSNSEVVLLDNIEILFDVALGQDPLRLLQRLSRNRTVVAAWNGSVQKGYLTYATPDHPEYRRYASGDFLVALPGATS